MQGAPGGEQVDPVSPAEVDTFAEIQIELATIQQQLAQQAREGDEQDLQTLQDQLQQEAAQVVQASELSAERFNEIATLVQQDTDLQRRVQTAIEEKIGS